MRTFFQIVLGMLLVASLASRVTRAQQSSTPLAAPIGATCSNATACATYIPLDVQSILYSSTYGPRAIDGGYEFHWGVDYNYGLGTPLYSVESGKITSIGLDAANDWVMGVNGSHHFTYIHMFDNSWISASSLPSDVDGHAIYAQECLNDLNDHPISKEVSDQSCQNPSDLVTLEETPCTTNINQSDANLAIVFWTDFAKNLANRVLTPCQGDFTIGGRRPTNSVTQSELIGLVGHSGRAALHGPHLHLQVDSGHESPLAFVQHDSPANGAPPTFAVAICKGVCTSTNIFLPSPASNVLNPATDFPLTIATEVNYSNVGHDLDAAGVFMFSANGPNPYTANCVGSGGITAGCFAYGGGTGTTRTIFPFPPSRSPRSEALSVALQQGVFPQTGGVVDFVTPTCCVSAPIDLTKVSPGPYLISVLTTDVLGDIPEQTSVTVVVPPKLTVTVVGPGSVSAAQAGLNSGINNCGQGQTCFDWFDTSVSDTITLTATPGPNSTFTGWSGACANAGNTNTAAVTLRANASCGATFSNSLAVFNVQVTGFGTGRITSTPAGISCGNGGIACSASFASGTTVSLTVVESTNSTFTGWSGACTGSLYTTSLTVNGGQTCTANFNPLVPSVVSTSCDTATGIATFSVTAPVGFSAFATGQVTSAIGCGAWSTVTSSASAFPFCQRSAGQPSRAFITNLSNSLANGGACNDQCILLTSPSANVELACAGGFVFRF